MITNSITNQVSAPIKWHGGKYYLADRIVKMMPKHVHYVEPFFGGGAVFFKKPISLISDHSEVINDIYGELVNFWQVLQSKKLFPEFERRIILTPFAKPVWETARINQSDDLVERACAFFIRYRQSRQGLGRDFATMSRARTRRGMNEQVSSWLSAIDGLADAHSRLSRVAIFCESATQLIEREDDNNSLFYCDPPYVLETRIVKNAYSHEMSELQHQELLDTLAAVRGKFIISGYRNKLYDAAAKKNSWNRTEIKIDNKASSQKIKPVKTECLWYNF